MKRVRNRYILVSDVVLLCLAPIALYSLRLESFSLGADHLRTVLVFAATTVPLQIAIFLAFGLYRRLWRHASIGELKSIFVAAAIAAVPTHLIGRYLLFAIDATPLRMPLSVLVPNALLGIGLVAAPRLLIRITGRRAVQRRARNEGRNVLIVGAGVAGEMIVKELTANHDLRMIPVGFVDDDRTKHKLRLADVPILGSLNDIPRFVREHDVEELIIAMPRAAGAVVRQVVRAAQQCGVRARIVPGLFEILSDRVAITAIREVQIDDLLRRDAVQTDLGAVSSIAMNRTVLVTGAGGSIGSELCRQLRELRPKRLVLVGHGENPIFEILNELKSTTEQTEIIPVIADIRDADRIRRVIAEYRPSTVFHAAAHKHVPLMEANVVEAVTNNVLGTRNLVEACLAASVERFVLISTDKAVRPTSIMGATKRVAEQIVHDAAMRRNRQYVAVRFGNVLGSNGSVVPTFVRQIRAGGPVTVTHPDVRRYFMTIPEAVQLVLQAGALATGGDLFMLDMGEPIRIADLAREMIRLSGFEVGSDIEIQFTGLRPGEKLYEEMFFSHEVALPTAHPKILRAKTGVVGAYDPKLVDDLIRAAVKSADEIEIRRILKTIVQDFLPSNESEVPLTREPAPEAARTRPSTHNPEVLISLPSS